MLGAGVLPPNYVRHVTFENATGITLLIKGSFRSNNQGSISVAAGATETLERTIDHGDYQLVDPIEHVTVHPETDSGVLLGELALSSNSGVKVPKYRVSTSADNENQVQFQLLNE